MRKKGNSEAQRLMQSGQSMYLLAAALIVLLGFAAMAVDVGSMEMKKAQLQSAIDAATLTAAHSLPDTVAATAAANSYVQKNGFLPSDISISFSDSNMRVNITATKKVPYTFAQVLGVSGKSGTGGGGASTYKISLVK